MQRLIVILVVLIVTALPLAALAQEPAEGEIIGQVINGTEGGGSVADVAITLITYIDDMISGTSTTRTDEEGNFRFSDVNREYTYLISAKYMEVDYYYPVEFEPGAATAYVEAGVCDTTDSDHAIRIGLAHTVTTVEEESLKITEVYWLVNDSDMTYVGKDGVLVFTLPEGAFGIGAPQELFADYEILGDNRITYLVPFPPGERQLVYSYQLEKPDVAELTIPLQLDYPTDSLDILVTGEDIEVAVAELAPAEPVVTDTGERFIHFHGENLPRGKTINLLLSSLSGGKGFPLFVLWIIIAVAVAGMAVHLIMRRKRAGGNE